MADVAAIVLAAGLGTRFGTEADESKVTALLDGKALVWHVVETALRSNAAPVIVVTGHAGGAVGVALDGLNVTIVQNADYASGMASSLKAGVSAVPANCKGALILLADMPFVRTQTFEALLTTFAANNAVDAIVPTFEGRQGNPVLLSRRLFGDLAGLRGDTGARRLLAQAGRIVVERPVDDPGIVRDIDTRDALSAFNAGR